jgi:hypothetical protein
MSLKAPHHPFLDNKKKNIGFLFLHTKSIEREIDAFKCKVKTVN